MSTMDPNKSELDALVPEQPTPLGNTSLNAPSDSKMSPDPNKPESNAPEPDPEPDQPTPQGNTPLNAPPDSKMCRNLNFWAMLIFWMFGVFSTFAHHFYNNLWDRKPVGSSGDQQWTLRCVRCSS